MKTSFLHISTSVFLLLLVVSCGFGFSQAPKKSNILSATPKQAIAKNHQAVSAAEVSILVEAYTYPTSMTLNGEYVVGSAFGGSSSYLWTASTGSITTLSGTPYGVASDGTVGGSFSNNQFLYNGSNVETAGKLNPSTGVWTFLGINPAVPQAFATDYNTGWDITADGTTLVGLQWYPGYDYRAFKWTQSNGYQDIGAGVGLGSRASGISANGAVVFGWAQTTAASRTPVIWYNGQAIFVNSNQFGEAYGSSPDGNYVTGELTGIGFLWTPTSTITFTNTLNNNNIVPTAAANDGTVLGYTVPAWPPAPTLRRAFVRDPQGIITTFNDYAQARGMTDAQEWTFYSVNDVSEDGNKFIGAGINPQGQDVTFLITFNTNLPVFSINPSNINFGMQPVGSQSNYQQLTITNQGTADLVITNVALGGTSPQHFILNDNHSYPFTLAPSEDMAFEAAFAPQQIGLLEAEINIGSNAGYFTVPLSGTGVDNVGLTDVENTSILHPNPAQAFTELKNTTGINELKIFNINGQLQQYNNYKNAAVASIDVSKLENGLYNLMFSDNNGQWKYVKLVVRH